MMQAGPGPVKRPAPELLVREAAPGDGADWDAFVDGEPTASYAHRAAWRDVVAAIYGHETLWRTAVDTDGTIHGIHPLVHVRSRLFGRYLVSMPYLDHGGPVGSPAAVDLLLRDAVHQAVTRGATLLEIRSGTAAPDPAGPSGPHLLAPARPKVTVVLPLPSSPDELWRTAFRPAVRSQVRRARREGMEVRFGPDQLPDFLHVYAHNMRDLGMPAHPSAFFRRVLHHFPGMLEIGAVYLAGEPVAAGCGFTWRGTVEMVWASSLRRFNRLAPNMLLYAAFMEHAIDHGAIAFSFGRCTPGTGTHRFKLQWGGRETPLPWSQWPATASAHLPADDAAWVRAARRGWSRLPIAAATLLGTPLVRRLPHY